MPKTSKMIDTLAHGYSSENTQLELSNEYQHGRVLIDTKESDGIAVPTKKIAIKSRTDHFDSGISNMLILIDAYFVILLQCNKMTK